jgi:hypothetical protein
VAIAMPYAIGEKSMALMTGEKYYRKSTKNIGGAIPYKDKNRAREHHKEYHKGWYQRHKEEVIERRKKRQQGILTWFRRYKSTLHCMDCGISHPAVLQFHHRDQSEKSFSIANVTARANRS